MKRSLIVAMARGGVIGRDNELPWRLPADLRRFKALTMGHHLVVGRRTWESIGRPLPGRAMLVVSRRELELPDGVVACTSIDEAMASAAAAGEEELFIAGGGEIYRQTIDRADRLYVTEIDLAVDGDAYFPVIDPEIWCEVAREAQVADEHNSHDHAFVRYERRDAEGAAT